MTNRTSSPGMNQACNTSVSAFIVELHADRTCITSCSMDSERIITNSKIANCVEPRRSLQGSITAAIKKEVQQGLEGHAGFGPALLEQMNHAHPTPGGPDDSAQRYGALCLHYFSLHLCSVWIPEFKHLHCGCTGHTICQIWFQSYPL